MSKIIFSICAVVLLAIGAFVFANSGKATVSAPVATKSNTICPDRPGCICSGLSGFSTMVMMASQMETSDCPMTPDCPPGHCHEKSQSDFSHKDGAADCCKK